MKIFIWFFIILGGLWTLRTIKEILFYLYLWQLKEYHLKRFIDHFRTIKGKSLIWNWKYLVKLILLPGILIAPLVGAAILALFYIAEVFLFLKKIYQKKTKYPVFTKKTILLTIIALALPFLFLVLLYQFSNPFGIFAFSILVFDILVPLVVTLLIFSIEPLVYLRKRQIIQKARKKRKEFKSLKVVGITGSYGKTSTKEILATLLEDKFKVLKTTEHINSEIGIAQLILNKLNSKHEVFVCEIGAYRKGTIKLVSSIVKPKIGIITGINQQHLATFGSQENIIDGKLELVKNLPNNGVAILNLDSPIIKEIKGKINSYNPNLKDIVFTSIKEKADLWADDIQIKKKELSFKLNTKKGKSILIDLNIAGRQVIENILTAAYCAMEMGMEIEEIKKVISKIEKKLVGLDVIKREGKLDIIDSSYSSNPAGALADLDHLKKWEGKRIIILRPLIELGETSKEIHKKIGQKIGEVCDLAVLVTKDHLEDIKNGAAKNGLDPDKIKTFDKITKKDIKFDQGAILLEGRIPEKIKKDLNLLK